MVFVRISTCGADRQLGQLGTNSLGSLASVVAMIAASPGWRLLQKLAQSGLGHFEAEINDESTPGSVSLASAQLS